MGGQEKEWTRYLLDDLRAFGINADQWTTAAQDEGGRSKTEEHCREWNVSWVTGSLKRNPGLDYGMQLYMFERDGTDKVEDSLKKTCSCWFTRGSRLATSGANLHILLLCCSVSFPFFLLLLNPWPFVQSFFDIHAAPTAVCGLIFGHVAFFEYHVPLPFFSWRVRGTFSLRMVGVFQPCDRKFDFDISLLFEISINQSINLLPPTSGDINARGGSMSSSYIVKYTTNGDSQRPLRWKTHRPQSTGAEFIMTISIRLLFLKKRGKPPTHKPRIPHTNK